MTTAIITALAQQIDNTIIAIADKKVSRNYLGASSIGVECDRKLWYSFHQPIKILDPRVNRIFDLGHLLESYCLSLLKHSGYEVFYEEGGSQFGFTDEEVAGHCDGVIMIDGSPYLLEIKSANDKRFAEMVKDGVEISDPIYYTQMQVYMKYMELDKALFFVMNKNTSAIHMEIVKYEKIKADYYVNRGKEIIRQEEEPERAYKSSAFFKCKFCDYREKCWAGIEESPKPSKKDLASFKLGENFLLPK